MPEDRTLQLLHAPDEPHRRRLRPRRIITHALLFLLLGTVVNVAVAWTLAVMLDPSHLKTRTSWIDDGSTFWITSSSAGPGVSIAYSQRSPGMRPVMEGAPVEESHAAWSGFDAPTREMLSGTWSTETRCGDARGWPLVALWAETYRSESARAENARVLHGIVTPLPPWRYPGVATLPRTLPLRPIWPGFAINTIFYGAGLWLLIAGPGVARRALRWGREVCSACVRSGALQPRRIITLAVLFLLLGTIVNVTLALGLSLVGQYVPPTLEELRDEEAERVAREAWPDAIVDPTHEEFRDLFTRARHSGVLVVSPSGPAYRAERPGYKDISTISRAISYGQRRTDGVAAYRKLECGWPWKSLRYVRIEMPEADVIVEEAHAMHRRIGAIQQGQPLPEIVLPTELIWQGSLLNSALWGLLLWLLFLPRAIRRAIRWRRGLCPACAYPRGDSEVCTECGTPVPLPAAAR